MKREVRRRALIVPIAIIGLATSGLTALVSGAVFNDSTGSAGNVLATGTIDISSAPTGAFLSVSNMMPGDSVVAPITVTNGGSAQLRYALSTSATNADGKNLATNLSTTVKSGVTTCTVAGFAGSGAAVVGPSGLDVLAVGSSAQGAQGGDRVLNAGASETLCFQSTLPLSAANALQGATTTANFTFSAEQTQNN